MVTGTDALSGVIIINVTHLSPISVAKGIYEFRFLSSPVASDQWRLTCRLVDAHYSQDTNIISYSLPSYRTSSLSIPVFISDSASFSIGVKRRGSARNGRTETNYAYMTSYTSMLVSIKIFGAFSSFSNCSS